MLAALVALLALGNVRMSFGGDAEAENAAANVLGLPPGAISGGGTLMVCGGGALPNEVYEEFVRLAGGRNGKIVLIPSAIPYSSQQALSYRFNGWLQYPVQSFNFVHATSREDAEKEEIANPLNEATGVWISGGAQGRLADLYKGTRVEKLIQDVLARGGVVGGTSAGAAIMSQTMIRYGTSREAVLDNGFSLLSSAVVDQHFSERKRQERLMGVLGQNPEKIGLGVDERTALIINANKVRVMGQNKATVIVPNQDKTMSVHLLATGEAAELVRVPAATDSLFQIRPSNLAKK
jgi:cyanophycinase